MKDRKFILSAGVFAFGVYWYIDYTGVQDAIDAAEALASDIEALADEIVDAINDEVQDGE